MKPYLTLSALSAISMVACTPTPPPICDREAQVWNKYETVEDVCEVKSVPFPAPTPQATIPHVFSEKDRRNEDASDETEEQNPTPDVVVEQSGVLNALSPPPTPAPVEPEPVVPTLAPAEPEPVVPTPAPVEPEPVVPTPAPVEPEPVDPTPEPVDPEPVTPTSEPVDPKPSKPAPPQPSKPAPPTGSGSHD